MPETTVAILRQMAIAAEAQGVAYVVVGAAARDLLLYHVFGEPTTRATRDVDVTVLVDNWASFDALKDRLVTSGAFSRVPGSPHRLLFGATNVPLDLVPFGGVEAPRDDRMDSRGRRPHERRGPSGGSPFGSSGGDH